MVSVIIPARNERFLDKTLNEIKSKFKGEYEIIVNLDGYDVLPNKLDGVIYIDHKESQGMRNAINEAVAMAKGDYILKIDAHCMIDDGLDLKLVLAHEPNWVQVPRRKRLEPHKWEIINDGRPDVDYMYMGDGFTGRVCGSKNLDPELKKILIDDTETFQGSCYFMTKEYFNHLGLMDVENFGTFGNEAQEICLQVFHDGGRVVVNKNTWYAHPHMGRKYSLDKTQIKKSRDYVIKLKELYGYKTEKESQTERPS